MGLAVDGLELAGPNGGSDLFNVCGVIREEQSQKVADQVVVVAEPPAHVAEVHPFNR
jgi:hypothetical protein